MVQRPDLFNAVLCHSPLLDMKRYHKLSAGASWIDEYGNPDLETDWAYLSKYSPYQNVKPNQSYPPIFLTTSTRDDRVHPGHARKMAAKMQEMGYSVYFHERTEGGHTGSSTAEQKAFVETLAMTYLLEQLR